MESEKEMFADAGKKGYAMKQGGKVDSFRSFWYYFKAMFSTLDSNLEKEIFYSFRSSVVLFQKAFRSCTCWNYTS